MYSDFLLDAAPLLAERDQHSHILLGRDERGDDHRLLDPLDLLNVRQFRRIVDHHDVAVVLGHTVYNRRRRGNEVELELALEPLLDDVHVQQAQKPASEAESQGKRCFRFIAERRIVQPQFLQRIAQIGVAVAVHRVDAGEDHGLHVLVTRERLVCRTFGVHDGIADLGIRDPLDAGDDAADLARATIALLAASSE